MMGDNSAMVSDGILTELQKALSTLKLVEVDDKATNQLGPCIKTIQQFPTKWHVPEKDHEAALSAFCQLLSSMSSILSNNSHLSSSHKEVSSTVRELLIGLFANNSFNSSSPTIQPTCGCNLFLTAASQPHTLHTPAIPKLPLLPHDALLMLFWIDAKLLNPGPGRPSATEQEILKRSPSGSLSVNSAALTLLHDPRVVQLVRDLLLLAEVDEATAVDPIKAELYVNIAVWAVSVASDALACLLPPGVNTKPGQLAPYETRSSALLLSAVRLAGLALERLAGEHGTQTEGRLTPEAAKSLAIGVERLLQLGDAVIDAYTHSTPEDTSVAKALETAGEVYGAAAAIAAVYARAAGAEVASDLASKLRNQVARAAWLGAPKAAGFTPGTPSGSGGTGSSPMSAKSGTPGSRTSGSALFQQRASVAVKPWRWNLGAALHEGKEEPESGVIHLMMGVTEALAQLLAWCWDANMHEPARHALLMPNGLPSKLEQQATAVLLGRFYILSDCDDALGRLILPLLGDALASGQEQLEPSTTTTILWVLGSMAAATPSGGEDLSWLMNQVLDLMTHLYRQPSANVQRTLMGGAPGASGECRDALASALEKLMSGVENAPSRTQQELKRRMLQLFHEVGLRASQQGPSAQWDLGALLPAVAATFKGSLTPLGPPKGMSVKSQLCVTAVEQLQHSQAVIIQLLRELWFHCAMYRFADPTGQWPKKWQQAAGVIAVATPLLLVGTGSNQALDIVERLRAEMGTVVTRAGPQAGTGPLHQDLQKLLSVSLPASSHQLKAAFLYAVATAEITRASLGPLEALSVCSPLVMSQLYLEAAPTDSEDSAWYKALLRRCCSAAVSRLSLLRNDQLKDAEPTDKARVEDVAECVAVSLIGYLADSGSHAVGAAPPVVAASQELLQDLLQRFPSLYWSPRCLDALLGELENEQGDRQLGELTSSTTATADLVWQQTQTWMAQASLLAPSRTEALLHIFLAGPARGGAGTAVQWKGAELLAVCARSRQMSELAGLEVHAEQGVLALSRKQHFLGSIEALQQQSRPPGSEPFTTELADQLESALSSSLPQSEVERTYLLCAALLTTQDSLPPTHPAITRLVRCMCQAPARRFTREMVALAVFSWTWITVAAPELEEVVLREVAAAWSATAQQHLGIFNGSKTDAGSESDVVDGIRCHHHWLSFFIELWNASKHSCKATRAATFKVCNSLLHSSLSHPDNLSVHPAAVAPRFRLLSLALDYSQHRAQQCKPASCPDAVALLNDRVLMASLKWFASPPAWHHKCSQREANERHAALGSFLSRLEAAKPLPTLTCRRLREALRKPANGSFTMASTAGTGPGLKPFIHPSAVANGNSNSNGKISNGVARAPVDDSHPVWKTKTHDDEAALKLHQLASLLVAAEAQRLEVWATPRGTQKASSSTALTQLKSPAWVRIAWGVNPKLALGLLARCPSAAPMRAELETLVTQHCTEPALKLVPEAAMLLATPKAAKESARQLNELDSWAPATAVDGLQLLSNASGSHPKVKAYAMRCLHTLAPNKLAAFLPQLVQSLRHDRDGQVAQLLVSIAKQSHVFSHHLIWALRAESKPPEEAFNPAVKRSGWQPPKDFGLWDPAAALQAKVLQSLSPIARQYWDSESQYFDAINVISGILKELPPDQRRAKINSELSKISLPGTNLYLPPCPDMRVVSAVVGSGTPMPSAAKVPILVAFKVESPSRPVPFVQPLIFKVGDDVRQDVLALQVIDVLKEAFQAAGLDLYLRPYGVLPTGYETGVIEVVPNTKSRSGVGEITEGGLYDYFQIQFGQPGSARFEEARRKFILSEAGYAIASFLLQCKDRHNGNLLIDAEGHLVHIDFGFILEISPGGNMGFESAAFKLSHEMTQLLDPGLGRNSAQFKMFEEYCVRGYLVARTVAEPILALVSLMAEAGLPCFSRGAPIENLRKRFHLELSEEQAAAFMRGAIGDAYQKWTTGFYDTIQYLQNAIPR